MISDYNFCLMVITNNEYLDECSCDGTLVCSAPSMCNNTDGSIEFWKDNGLLSFCLIFNPDGSFKSFEKNS